MPVPTNGLTEGQKALNQCSAINDNEGNDNVILVQYRVTSWQAFDAHHDRMIGVNPPEGLEKPTAGSGRSPGGWVCIPYN